MTINPKIVLKEAEGLISERGADYGGVEDNFSNIAVIFSAMTGKDFTAHDVAMLLTAVKIARMRQSPGKTDNYLDAINYLAFAHELRPKPKLHASAPVRITGEMQTLHKAKLKIWED